MEHSRVTKQIFNFQKMSFEMWYDAVALMQNQSVSMMDKMLDQSSWLPDNRRQAIKSWMDVCEKEGDRFKSYVDDSFAGVEAYITESKPVTSQKTKKQTN
jgi:hypothetical protein